ncbi:MAG: deoxyribodipyrimidine photo-lyase [Gaiellales bacterium]
MHLCANLANGICDPRRLHNYGQIDSPRDDACCVVLWMSHAQRSRENLALDVAIAAANDRALPLIVAFRLAAGPPSNDMRHSAHMIAAFPELIDGINARNAAFALLEPAPLDHFIATLHELEPALVICDDDAMVGAARMRTEVGAALEVPLIAVDADVLVPSRVFIKREYAARTLRPKFHRVLHEFDGERGGRAHVETAPAKQRPAGLGEQLQWFAPGSSATLDVGRLDRVLVASGIPDTAGRVQRPSGMAAAAARLRGFVDEQLNGYATNRNQPHLDATSGLSVFLHFGQISPHVVLDAVRGADAPAADVAAFVEEFTVRRELAVNFARSAGEAAYSLACAPDWAKLTHAAHAGDPRTSLHSEAVMLACETHDPLWNAAQRQMLVTGTMHGYLRMYWAKQILTWTPSAEEAYELALGLHDRFSMDGRDPNSLTGVAWAIAGVHDRAWPEREVFGKIRSMTFASTSRKFNSAAYIARWSGDDGGGGEQQSLAL